MPSLGRRGQGFGRAHGSTDYQSIDWFASALSGSLTAALQLAICTTPSLKLHLSLCRYDSMPDFKLNAPSRYAPFLVTIGSNSKFVTLFLVAPLPIFKFIDIGSSYRPRFFIRATTNPLSLVGAWWIAGCRLQCARYAPFLCSTFLSYCHSLPLLPCQSKHPVRR